MFSLFHEVITEFCSIVILLVHNVQMFPYSWLGLPHIYRPAPQYIPTAVRDSSTDFLIYFFSPQIHVHQTSDTLLRFQTFW